MDLAESPVAMSPSEVLVEGIVRPMRAEEVTAISALHRYLRPLAQESWPGERTVLVWERTRQAIGGFIVFSRGPVPEIKCIEAVWVASYLHRAPIERALLLSADEWVVG